MTLAAGRLRHHVTFYELTRSIDMDSGEHTEEWTPLWVDVPAEVAPLSVREFVASQATQVQVSVRITIRRRSGVKATMRVEHRDKMYNVEGVLPDAESGLEYLTLPCSEVLPEEGA